MTAESGASHGALVRSGIVCLSTIDWEFLWQRQQELMSRFARVGVPVLYVEPLGIRSARLGDAGRIAGRVRRWLRQDLRTLVPLEPRLYRLSPLAVPLQGNRAVDALNRRLVTRAVRRAGAAAGLRAPVLWCYYATRTVLELASTLAPSIVVYDCIDDVAHNPKGVARDYATTEGELLRRADLVLTSSSPLFADKRPLNPHTHLIPPGANVEHFAAPVAEAPDLTGLPHPRLGFFGGIDERIDLRLLETLARRRPDWTVVLIGVVRTDPSLLRTLRNVVVMGQRPYAELPAYVQHCDVLLIPYLINEYTMRIYPAKVFECLATGKPVVATALPDLSEWSSLIRLLDPAEDPVAVVEQALADDSPALAQRRRQVAAANSWDARFEEIQRLLRTTLAERGRAL